MKRIFKSQRLGNRTHKDKDILQTRKGARPGRAHFRPHAHVCTDDVCYEKRPRKPLFQNLPQELTDAKGVFP